MYNDDIWRFIISRKPFESLQSNCHIRPGLVQIICAQDLNLGLRTWTRDSKKAWKWESKNVKKSSVCKYYNVHCLYVPYVQVGLKPLSSDRWESFTIRLRLPSFCSNKCSSSIILTTSCIKLKVDINYSSNEEKI